MSSTYSTSLRLTLMGTGDNSGSWGTVTNTNLGTYIESAIAGSTTIPATGQSWPTITLTATDGTVDQARNMYLNMTGTLAVQGTVILPNLSPDTGLPVTKMYIVNNATTGGQSVLIKTSASGSYGTVIVPNGAVFVIWSDGYNVTATTNYIPLITSTAITGSTINSTTIGATTPSTGNFTSGAYQTLNITSGGTLTNVTLANATGTLTTATITTACDGS